METHKRFESNLWTIPKTEFKFWKVKWVGPGPAHIVILGRGRLFLSHCEPAQGRLTSLFKTWIHFLELFINLIQNACVFPNTILKHLYWSEFGFLVLLWSFFHLFTFLKSKQFQSEPAQGRPTCFLRNENSLRSEPAQGRLTLKSRKKFAVGKKSFLLKNIFFFAFYERLSFFDGKYGYFAAFDKQILSKKLIFPIL